MATPNSGSPEPRALPTFENLPGRFDQRKGSEDAAAQNGGLSIGARYFFYNFNIMIFAIWPTIRISFKTF